MSTLTVMLEKLVSDGGCERESVRGGGCVQYTILAFVKSTVTTCVLLCRCVDACLWLLYNDIHGPCNGIHLLSHHIEEVMIKSDQWNSKVMGFRVSVHSELIQHATNTR